MDEFKFQVPSFAQPILRIKRIHPDAIIPTRAHSGDAGMDVYALEDVTILRDSDHLFKLGWQCAIRPGVAMIVKEKSGRAVKDKLDVGACVIDSGYRGEVHVHLFNNGSCDVNIKKGEKIAQVILVEVWDGDPIEVTELEDTSRGDGGFGSSGLKHTGV